jgi:hypothetical protein
MLIPSATFHEAGHAVVADHFGRRVAYLAVSERIATGSPCDWGRSAGDDFSYATALLRWPERAEATLEFFDAVQRAETILRSRWRQVERLSAALWIHARLDAEQIQETLTRTDP